MAGLSLLLDTTCFALDLGLCFRASVWRRDRLALLEGRMRSCFDPTGRVVGLGLSACPKLRQAIRNGRSVLSAQLARLIAVCAAAVLSVTIAMFAVALAALIADLPTRFSDMALFSQLVWGSGRGLSQVDIPQLSTSSTSLRRSADKSIWALQQQPCVS
tara:strand:- start:3100 stop:3576 length:477 start_codon:yes stop_codon:yes gene_type:complete